MLRRDTAKGLAYLRRAAEQGLPAAQLLLGRSHDNGLFGLREDCAVALGWYRRAADQLDSSTAAELGARREELRRVRPPRPPAFDSCHSL